MEGENTTIGRSDCGPACLKEVLEHFGQYFTIEELATACGTNAAGTTAAQLKTAAEAKGLNVTASLRQFSLLGENTAKPAIIHWGGGHFVVLKEVDFEKRTAIVYDPNLRRTTIHTKELEFYYSGVVMEFSE